jgi:hypothetical protein
MTVDRVVIVVPNRDNRIAIERLAARRRTGHIAVAGVSNSGYTGKPKTDGNPAANAALTFVRTSGGRH